ncbi:TolC family protein [Pseudomonas aeruginosa]|uniref:TolC family protein n=1 Tax=Ectopseudomonas toyotomiensis TaxID=554344 RepID=A0ABD7DVL5_9GAMM|nr:TolC family protein [Pseudomonas toyotomiensis]MCT1346565.1 TolC family protein [Pseudomonas aeruginosa]QSL92551.1 TolC family protein [Pseudomonas toyotomiensis]
MPAFLFPRRGYLGVLAAAFCAVPWVAAQAQPLTFERAQALAEQRAPENLARQAQVASAQQAVGPADALPDPKLILGIDNLPIEGPDRYTLNRDSMTMRRIGLMQEVPNGDKRQARRQLAEASVVRAEAEQRAMQLEVKRQTALSWLDVYYAEHSVGLFDQLDRQIELLRSTVQSLIAGGSAQPGELLQADQEALALQDRRDELSRDVAIARAKLRRWIGNEADQLLAGDVPNLSLDAPHLQHRLAQHPDLRAASARVGEASAELNEAVAEKTPDWGVEFAYNNRDNQFGDMVMVQFTFDLPLFVGTRQGPKINAKQQSVSQMEAEQEVLLRAHQAELESGLAELEQLRRALARTEKTLIPLASKRADLELAAYQAGNSQLASVITAQRELIEAQLRQIEQQRKLSQLSASLYYAYVEGLQ